MISDFWTDVVADARAKTATSTSTDEYDAALAKIAAIKPMATFQAAFPFDIIKDGLSVALVRPAVGNPRQIEVIDFLRLGDAAFERAIIKLAQFRRQFANLVRNR